MLNIKKIKFLTLLATMAFIGFAYAMGGNDMDFSQEPSSDVAVKPAVSSGAALVEETSTAAQRVAEERASKHAADEVTAKEVNEAFRKKAEKEMLRDALAIQALAEDLAKERAEFEAQQKKMAAIDMVIQQHNENTDHELAVDKSKQSAAANLLKALGAAGKDESLLDVLSAASESH
jgi:hypothetical protein